MKAILNNGVEVTPMIVTGGPKYTHGANRDALTFVFPDCSLDEKERLFIEANCESITIVGDDGSEAIHKGYVIPEIIKKPVEVEKATVNTEAVYENRVYVTMSQRTYAETKQHETDVLLNALLGGAE